MSSTIKTTSQTTASTVPPQESLTPELVEDEAIRGDIVIRWAVVLLAFLLACTEINTSPTLVHVRSGEYLATHGVLPPRADVFSYTVAERPWVNLHWMYDLFSARLYNMGSAAGLVLFKAVVVCITFWLLTSISVRYVSTWWTSICATLALFACFPQFTATPETITFLGIVLMLWLLFRWKWTENNRYLYGCLVLILLWGQFDSRLFLGLTILLMYGIGELIGLWLDRPGLESSAQRKVLWQVIGLSFLVALIHPFGWHTLLQPWELFGVEFPALRARYGTIPLSHLLSHHPVASSFFWGTMSRNDVASIILVVTAFISFCLNRKKADVGEMFIYLGMIGYALLASHFLAMAAVVSSVLAAVNAQYWYRNTYRQTYTVELRDILFSQGGRAIMVLTLAAFAFLAISGRLAGVRGNQIGLDFHPALKSHCDGLRNDLEQTFDDRPFNFTLRQGDILIWIGKKPFVDSRIQIYCGTAENNLLEHHNIIRRALHPKDIHDPLSGRPAIWQQAFDRYHVTYVIPRLFGIPPDYHTYFGLSVSQHWRLQKLGSATAIFYREDLIEKKPEGINTALTFTSPPSSLAKYLQNNNDVMGHVFREEEPEALLVANNKRYQWATPPTWQQQHVWLLRSQQPAPLFEAYHCMEHIKLASIKQISMRDQAYVAMAYRIIRKTNEVLSSDPNNEEAFRLQGMAYRYLGQFEQVFSPTTGGTINGLRRYYQAIAAINQAVVINPDNAQTRMLLYQMYASRNQPELALQELEAYHRITSDRTLLTPDDKVLKRSLKNLRNDLVLKSETVDKNITKYLQDDISRVVIAQQLAREGFTLKAMSLLEEETVADAQLQRDPSAQLFKAKLLLEMGQVEEAYNLMQPLSNVAQELDLRNWQELTALLHMAHGEYDDAIPYWEQTATQQKREQAIAVFRVLPFIITPLPSPLNQTAGIENYSHRIAVAQLNAALCELEAGRNTAAEKRIRNTLKHYTHPSHDKLLRFYLYLLTNEWLTPPQPNDWK